MGPSEPLPLPRIHLLFETPPMLDVVRMTQALADYDPSFVDAQVVVDPLTSRAVARFAGHEIAFRGVGDPLPEALVEPCIHLAHYDEDRKEIARRHRCFLVCEHLPSELGRVAQHLALMAFAGAQLHLGRSVAVNLAARTSAPTELFAKATDEMWSYLGELPLLVFVMGFAKYNVLERSTVWMRTHGGPHFEIPDFARLAPSHAEGVFTFTLLNDVVRYAIESKVVMAHGDVAAIGESVFVRFRLPSEEESFLLAFGPLLVLDVVRDPSELPPLPAP